MNNIHVGFSLFLSALTPTLSRLSGYLRAALNNMLGAYSFTIGEILDVMERIRLSAPKAKEIWECSSQLGAVGIWDILEGVARQEQRLRDSVAQGHLTMDSCFGADTSSM